MNISDRDLKLGQLVLVRGLIDLSGLLSCVHLAGRGNFEFFEALVTSGGIDREVLEQLQKELESMPGDTLAATVSLGESIVAETLHQRTLREFAPHKESASKYEKTWMLPDSETGDTKREESLGGSAEDRYEFLDELGRGGMGQVLRAHDRLLERAIALKTLLPDHSENVDAARLISEARLTGRLEHPSIVPLYDVGTLSNGVPFYTMRVLNERSLQTVIEQMRRGDGAAPSLIQLIQALRQVCLAIQFAHDRGVIHRDLKPENILLGDYGEVFVIDWGIAKTLSRSDKTDPSVSESSASDAGLIGTPLYMAPEQAQGHNDEVDERTDIYALGAMLYEILTLSPVFESPTVLGLLMTIIQEEPEAPSRRAPDREIPRDLEEICLRAIAKEREHRFESAQRFAEELELFLEGAKERERQEGIARELIKEAQTESLRYRQAQWELSRALEQRDRLARTTPAWAVEEERAILWASEEAVEELRVEVERAFGRTTRLLGQSLSHSPLARAHEELAQLYWERFVDAEDRDDRAMAAYFENLVRQHDQGQFVDRLNGLADLVVSCATPQVELTLSRVHERRRRFVADEVIAVSDSPLLMDRLPHGRYQLNASAPGFHSLQMPIFLKRGDRQFVDVSLFSDEIVPPDFVVIPGGSFEEGRYVDGPTQIKGSRHHLDTFAIQREPVTCQQYVDFLNDLARTSLAEASRYAPRSQADGPSYLPLIDGRFHIPTEDLEGDAWNPDWPILIINFHDAQAYARWRSHRDGHVYRLPTAQEWEKAARGIDGRLYPWGNHFDPSFCRMRDSIPGKPTPAPVGSFPADSSPYGVRDLAGNISEWTETRHESAEDIYVLCGGSYNSMELMCRLDWRMHSPSTFRYGHYGFRLAMDLPGEGSPN